MPFRYLFEMGHKDENCLDRLDFDAWIQFVFGHPTVSKDHERWYESIDAENYYYRDEEHFLDLATKLLQNPSVLSSHYSVEQVVQGFWCLIGAFELPDVLEDATLNLKNRKLCILTLESLYRELFCKPGFEKIAMKYWHPLTFSFAGSKGRPADPDLANIQDAIFESLEGILNLGQRICSLSALHGLGHLHHERSPEVISQWLRHQSFLRGEDKDFALACIRGDMDSMPLPPLN